MICSHRLAGTGEGQKLNELDYKWHNYVGWEGRPEVSMEGRGTGIHLPGARANATCSSFWKLHDGARFPFQAGCWNLQGTLGAAVEQPVGRRRVPESTTLRVCVCVLTWGDCWPPGVLCSVWWPPSLLCSCLCLCSSTHPFPQPTRRVFLYTAVERLQNL